MEDYEHKYKETLERAKKYPANLTVKNVLEYVFPELSLYNNKKQNNTKYTLGDTIYYKTFDGVGCMVVYNIIDLGDGNAMYEDIEGNWIFEKDVIKK